MIIAGETICYTNDILVAVAHCKVTAKDVALTQKTVGPFLDSYILFPTH